MFGSTEISRKYICYAKFSVERKLGVIVLEKKLFYNLYILFSFSPTCSLTFTLEVSHFIVFHTTFEYKSMRQRKQNGHHNLSNLC